MLLLAQVAPALTDSIAGANPVLTQVNASDEMNLWSMAIKGGWIMIVLGLMSVLCFYILFERNYVIRKAGKEDPQFMDKIKDYILGGELKAAIAYCRSVDTPSARMIEKGISRLGRPVNDVQAAIEKVKESLKGTDVEAIKTATEEVTKAFYPIAEKMYQQANPQGGDAGCAGDCGNCNSDPNVVDADYTVVDDENK